LSPSLLIARTLPIQPETTLLGGFAGQLAGLLCPPLAALTLDRCLHETQRERDTLFADRLRLHHRCRGHFRLGLGRLGRSSGCQRLLTSHSLRLRGRHVLGLQGRQRCRLCLGLRLGCPRLGDCSRRSEQHRHRAGGRRPTRRHTHTGGHADELSLRLRCCCTARVRLCSCDCSRRGRWQWRLHGGAGRCGALKERLPRGGWRCGEL